MVPVTATGFLQVVGKDGTGQARKPLDDWAARGGEHRPVDGRRVGRWQPARRSLRPEARSPKPEARSPRPLPRRVALREARRARRLPATRRPAPVSSPAPGTAPPQAPRHTRDPRSTPPRRPGGGPRQLSSHARDGAQRRQRHRHRRGRRGTVGTGTLISGIDEPAQNFCAVTTVLYQQHDTNPATHQPQGYQEEGRGPARGRWAYCVVTRRSRGHTRSRSPSSKRPCKHRHRTDSGCSLSPSRRQRQR